MANNIKYKNQLWGEPIPGETLSVNGHYCGHQLGSVMPDAKCEMTAHMVEAGIIRLGTMTQDVKNNIEQDGGKMITVHIGESQYTAEEGMTWEEWVNSDYAPTYTCEYCGEVYSVFDITIGNCVSKMVGCECDIGRDELIQLSSVPLDAYYSDDWNLEDVVGVSPSDVIRSDYHYGEH